MRGILPISCLLLSAWPALAASAANDAPLTAGDEVTGMAVVVDGDTYLIDGVKWREQGIDAPEMRGDTRGPLARAALDDLVAGRPVTCIYYGSGRHERNVGRCIAADGRGLALEMLRGGWAFVHRVYVDPDLATSYNAAEAEARAAGRGFWVKSTNGRQWKWGDLILVLVGGFVAAGGGWLAQIHVARTDLKRRQQSVSNAIGSEIAFILVHLNSGTHATAMSEAHMLADIDKYVHRYKQMAGDLGLLPPELITLIDGFYGTLFRTSDAAKICVKENTPAPSDMVPTLIKANEELGQAIFKYHARFDKSPVQEPAQNN